MKGTHMTDLLDETLAADGGLARWKELTNVHTHLASTGAVWAVKGQTGLFGSVDVDVDPHEQFVAATPFVHDGWRGIFERDRVRVENTAGEVEEERVRPRSSFDGHELKTQWDHLHAIYFGGAALWTYVTLPFVLAQPGFTTEEIEPWKENDESWRRLRVTFPKTIATHCSEQVLYIDDAGLIRRHDYTAEVTAGGPGAHYLHGHREFDGIVFPTRRQVFPRQPDNESAGEPLLINMEFDGYVLT
jgi:hypothetical protein